MPNKDEQSHNGYIVDKEKDKRLTRIKEKKMSAQKQIFSDLPFYKSMMPTSLTRSKKESTSLQSFTPNRKIPVIIT